MALPVSAQEDPLHRTEMKPSPAGSAATSPESTTPPLTGPKSSPSATTAPPLTDVLFKNLKARSIGPAVMGGRVSDIALDPHNPFIFYVGLAHGGVFKTEDPENHPELQRNVGNVELGVGSFVTASPSKRRTGRNREMECRGRTCRKLTSCRNGCEATPKLFASRRPGFSKAEIGGNPTPNSEHSRARAPTPKALTRALSALSPSSVGSYHLCRGFPARSIRDRCVELRKPLRSQQKIAQFRWASLSLQPVLARLRCVLAKIDSRYWVWRRAARASPFRI